MKLAKTIISLLAVATLFAVMASVTYANGPVVNLPPGTCDAVIAAYNYPHPNAYFVWLFSGIPAGYDVQNGYYNAFCVQQDVYVYVGTHYQVTFYSSYEAPGGGPSGNWDLVNYVMNHRVGNSPQDLQNAIWLVFHGQPASGTPAVIAMVTDAYANGVGYTPSAPGEWLAIIVWIDGNTQCTFIQIQPRNEIPEVPLGTLVGSMGILAAVAGFVKFERSRPKLN